MSNLADFALLPVHLVRLVGGLLMDPRVPRSSKAGVAGGLLYAFSPIDLLPEALLGRLGLVDDGVVLLRVARRLLADVDEQVAREHWHGDPTHLTAIRRALVSGDELAARTIHALRDVIMAPARPRGA